MFTKKPHPLQMTIEEAYSTIDQQTSTQKHKTNETTKQQDASKDHNSSKGDPTTMKVDETSDKQY